MIRVGINLLFLIPGKVGGSEVYTRRLVQGLTDGMDMELCLVCNSENYDTFQEAQNLKRILIDYPVQKRSARIHAEQSGLPALAGEKRFDLIWSPGNTAPKKAPCPQVVTIHDLQHEYFPEYFGFLRLRSRRMLFRRAIKAADKIIAISECTAKDLERFHNVESAGIEIIYHGVDSGFGDVPQDLIERVKHAYDLPQSFAFLPGKTFKHKNHVNAVKAVSRLREKWDIELPLILTGGEDTGHAQLTQAIQSLGMQDQVRHLGRLGHGELPALYRLASCLLFPSRFEGFGLPVLEAFVCRCPVVCSNVTSLPEVAGDAAMLVDPDDIEGMAHAIRLIIKEPEIRKGLVQRGRQRASEFTWYRTIQSTAQLLHSVAKPGKP